MRRLRWLTAAVAAAFVCAVGAPLASALVLRAPQAVDAKAKKKKKKKPVACKPNQARLRIGKRTICVTHSLHATSTSPQAAVAATALHITIGNTRDRRGRRSKSLSQLLGRVGPHARSDLERAVAVGLAKGEQLAHGARASSHSRAVAADACGGGSSSGLQGAGSAKVGEATVDLSIENGAAKLGIDLKGKGISVSVNLRSCGDGSLQLDSCPTADGKVEGHGHSELEASFKVTEGATVVLDQAFKFGGETTVKAQTGDDGKLDYYDIKHIYKLVASFGGSKARFGPLTVDMTYIGEAHIDMRSGSGAPPPATVDVMLSMAGADPAERIAAEIKVAHESQAQADKEFAAEVEKATKQLRAQEGFWRTPNKCASVRFEPASETLKLRKGQTGTFKSRAEASGGGAPPVATWTLSTQQNASFSPAAGTANPLSTSYSVTNAGAGIVVSTVVKATSKAGVAEGTWKQKTGKLLKTISGTFTGKIENHGSLIEWSGTATFERIEIPGADPEVASTFKPTSSHVEATASGAFQGAECTQSGSGPVELEAGTPVWTVEHNGETTEYQAIAPWSPTAEVPVILSSCNPSSLDGEKEELVLDAPAIQSGPVLGSITHVSFDGVTFEGGAFEERAGEKYAWSWSFKGSE